MTPRERRQSADQLRVVEQDGGGGQDGVILVHPPESAEIKVGASAGQLSTAAWSHQAFGLGLFGKLVPVVIEMPLIGDRPNTLGRRIPDRAAIPDGADGADGADAGISSCLSRAAASRAWRVRRPRSS
jgi:hypothetical protein